MDGATVNMVWGIIGSAVGVLGGMVGTYCGIKNTNGPRERAFMVKASLICWALVLTFLAVLVLVPMTYKVLVWIPYPFLLWWGIRTGNRIQARIRAEKAPRTQG